MPTLNDALIPSDGLAGYARIPQTPAPPNAPPPNASLEPERNTMIRCPLPPLWEGAPDALRQFYVGGQVPQARIMSPRPIPNNGNGGPVTENVYVAGNGNGGNGASPAPAPAPAQAMLYATQAVVTTPQLAPGARWTGSVPMAQSFQLLGLAASLACRVELYGSATAQTADQGRGIDVPLAAGSFNGLMSDVVLDTVPFIWSFENRVGANCDVPQSNLVYVTLTNLSAASAVLVLSIQYVPLASGTNPDSPQVQWNNKTLSTLDLGSSSNIVMRTGANFTGPISSPYVNVTSATGLQIQNDQIGTVNLKDSQNIALLTESNVFQGEISAPTVNATTAAGLKIAGSQIASADLSDSSNIAYLNQQNVFSGAINAATINATSASGLQIAGSQIKSADLSDSTNIAYLDVANTFSAAVNAPVVSVNSASGLQVSGAQISTSTLADGSNVAKLNVSNTFTGTVNAPVVNVSTSSGLQVNGSQLASVNLLDDGNLAKLNGVNVFENEVTAPQITATGSQANVFTGPVTSAAFNQATGSTTANVFTGAIQAASFTQTGSATNTFTGNIGVVDINVSGNAVVTNNINVGTIGGYLPPSGDNANNTLAHVQTFSIGGTAPVAAADLYPISGFTWTVTSAGTTDVFNILASIQWIRYSGSSLFQVVAVADGDTSTQFGLAISDATPTVFFGSKTGLAAGSHSIQLYFVQGTSGEFSIVTGQSIAQLQQISA